MIELDEAKFTLQGYKDMLKEVGDSLDLESKERKIEELSSARMSKITGGLGGSGLF